MPTLHTSATIPRQDLAGSLMETSLDQMGPIASLLMPEFPVPEQNGRFGKVPVEALLARADVRRAARGKYNRSTWELEDDSYNCDEYGHEEVADERERRMYDMYLDYEVVLSRRGQGILVREQEIRTKDLLHNTSTFPQSGNTGVAVTNEWDDAANATPIDDVHAGIEGIRARCGLVPDTLQVAFSTLFDLSRCDQILERLKYTEKPGGLLPAAEIARALGIKRVVAPGSASMYNSANLGLAPSLADIWSNEYAFLCVTDASKDISAPCIGKTFVWEEDGGMLTVEQYPDPESRADIYRVRQSTDEKVLLTACGYLFSNITT